MSILPFKNYLILAVVAAYSFGIWHVSAKYTEDGWVKEKAALVSKALETKQQRQELADLIGSALDAKLQNRPIIQRTINQKVIHEITKEPVYTECRTTPDGVRLIEDTINNQGQPTSK